MFSLKDRFSAIVEKISAEPQGFCTDKVRKTVVKGFLSDDDMEYIVDILVNKQDSMTQDEMTQEIGKLDMLTPEAASVLVTSWFDGGKNKEEWEKKFLYNWVKQKLITRMGSKRFGRVALVVAGKKVSCVYGLSGRNVCVRGVNGAGVDVVVNYLAGEDVSIENCKYDIDMLVRLWKESLPISGGYRVVNSTIVGECPGFEFMVSMPWGLGMMGNVPLIDDVRNVVEG